MRRLAVLPVGLLTLALLAGCGGAEHSDTAHGSGSRGAPYAATAPSGPPALREAGPASPKQQNSDSADTTVERKEIVTGSVDITTADPIGAAGKVADRVRTVDGRVDSRSEQPGTDTTKARATLTVRVPADKTDGFVDGLGGIGEVTSVTTERSDVTMQWQDLDARIKALQASVDRLRALVSSAATTADLIAAENALSSRQGELDSLTARKRQLDDEVALSTLTIQLSTDEPPGSKPDNYWNRIVDGWNSLVRALKSTGNALPWLGFLLLLAAVVWGVVRLATRRRSPAPQQVLPTPPESERDPAADKASVSPKGTAAEKAPAPVERTAAEKVSVPAERTTAEKASAPAEGAAAEKASVSAEETAAEKAPVHAERTDAENASAPVENAAAEKGSGPAEAAAAEGDSPQRTGRAETGGADAADRRPGGDQAEQ
ncbi:DUF4349 domain-containing protein [Nocardia wallacei]|uniref:DUF4349 domain-containing protein n=1 Tax=Nocardia wallacei TaxID=480035 RepID=UPI0024577601|nr:DUF4349 domain-containing protein [Nocardia wallacei]